MTTPVKLASKLYQRTTNQSNIPMVILHGLFGSKSNWSSLAKRFAHHTNVYCLDLREHGESPHTDSMTLTNMANDLQLFLNDNQQKKVNLVGHSLGGKVAMRLAQTNPSLLNKLVVVDISPVPADFVFGGEIHRFVQYMLDIKKGNYDPKLYFEERISDSSIINFLMTNYKNGQLRINIDTIAKSIPILNSDHSDYQCSVETLFIKGTRSSYVKNDSDLKKYFPNSKLIALDAGHWVHAEKPNEFASDVIQFLYRK